MDHFPPIRVNVKRQHFAQYVHASDKLLKAHKKCIATVYVPLNRPHCTENARKIQFNENKFEKKHKY